MRKYNYDFSPVLLEECNKDDLNEREIYWIKKLKTFIGEEGYNMTHGGETSSESLKIKVYQYDLDGKYIKTFDSISDAAREYNGSHNGICRVLSGEFNTAYEYRWSANYHKQLPPLQTNHTGRSKAIGQYDLNDNLITVFSSTKEAARQLNKSQGNISSAANGKRKTAYGYKWKFVDKGGEKSC